MADAFLFAATEFLETEKATKLRPLGELLNVARSLDIFAFTE